MCFFLIRCIYNLKEIQFMVGYNCCQHNNSRLSNPKQNCFKVIAIVHNIALLHFYRLRRDQRAVTSGVIAVVITNVECRHGLIRALEDLSCILGEVDNGYLLSAVEFTELKAGSLYH